MWATDAGVRSFYAPAAHVDGNVGGTVGNDGAIGQQRGLGFELSGSADDAMGRPVAKFRIVFSMRAHVGDDGDIVRRCVVIQGADSGNDLLGAGDVESAGRKEEIDLCVDIEENGFHFDLRRE